MTGGQSVQKETGRKMSKERRHILKAARVLNNVDSERSSATKRASTSRESDAYESRQFPMRTDEANKLGEALGVSPQVLLDDEG